MIGPNLSEWALLKRSLVVFLMVLAVALIISRLTESVQAAAGAQP